MTVATASSEWTREPFRMGTAEEFERLREVLRGSGFVEADLCAACGVPTMHNFPIGEESRDVFRDPRDAQSVLVQLFLDCASIPWEVARDVLPPAVREAIEGLGLLVASPRLPGGCEATVALYPTNGVYIASDRHVAGHTTGAHPPADLVYSAMTKETLHVLSLMPRTPCDAYLELCSGTGVAALIAGAHYAKRAVAIDVTERSTRFARFNIALNALSNVTALQGDLYAPADDQTFDLIVAHPPYVPSFETEYVYRDGGEDGEQVTRRVIADLARHLRPGGQFYCDCMLSDRVDSSIEDHAGEFDVLIGESRSFEPVAYYADQARHGKISFSSIERRHDTFARLGIQRFVSVSILCGRRRSTRPVATARRLLSPATTRDDFQWLLRWSETTAAWDEAGALHLLDERPRANPHVELRSRSSHRAGQWMVEECRLVTVRPFMVEVSCPNWVATLLTWCDGRATARDHFARLLAMGLVPPGALDGFAVMLRQLVDSGVLEIDEGRLARPGVRDSPSAQVVDAS